MVIQFSVHTSENIQMQTPKLILPVYLWQRKSFYGNDTWNKQVFSGLDYKHIIVIVSDNRKWRLDYYYFVALSLAFARVVNYAPKVTLKIVASLTDDSRGITYVYSTGH